MGQISVSLPSDGSTADVSDYNGPITTIVTEINGNIDNSNVKDAAGIATTKLADDAGITAAKLADNAVTTAKVTDGAITPAKMSAVKLYGYSTITASPPATNTGEFKVQCGSSVVTTNSGGDGSIAFPVAFPTGIVSVVACDGDDNNTTAVSIIGAGTKTGFSFSSAKTSASVRVNWIAYGW